MKIIQILLFAAALAFARAAAADTIWSASVDNGDKPGVGFQLTQSQRGITGFGYLLDPSYAHDFSHGAKRKMEVTDSKPTELRFKIDWGDGKQRSYVLQFDNVLESKPVKGTLRQIPASGEPTEFTFKPTKSK